MKYAAGQATQLRIGHREDRVEVGVTDTAAPVPVSARARRDLSGGRGLGGPRDRVVHSGTG
jgi:hypothetical protein